MERNHVIMKNKSVAASWGYHSGVTEASNHLACDAEPLGV